MFRIDAAANLRPADDNGVKKGADDNGVKKGEFRAEIQNFRDKLVTIKSDINKCVKHTNAEPRIRYSAQSPISMITYSRTTFLYKRTLRTHVFGPATFNFLLFITIFTLGTKSC